MTSTIPTPRGAMSRPAKRAKDIVGQRLLVGAVAVTLLGVLALSYGLVSLLGRDATQTDAIRSLVESSMQLREQVQRLGAVPVVTPEEIEAPARAAPALDGTDGTDGADGIDGVDGVDGQDAPCLASPAGCMGADGADGTDGRDGIDGIDGEDGRDGIDGRDGADGRGVATAGPTRDATGTCVFRTTYTDGATEDRPTRDENCPPPPEPSEPPSGGDMGLVGIAMAISSLLKVPEIRVRAPQPTRATGTTSRSSPPWASTPCLPPAGLSRSSSSTPSRGSSRCWAGSGSSPPTIRSSSTAAPAWPCWCSSS